MRFSDAGVVRYVPDHRGRTHPWAGVVGGGGIVVLAYLVGVEMMTAVKPES